MITKRRRKPRTSRISFCEWSHAGTYNNGGVICKNCNFSKSHDRNEHYSGTYNSNNKLDDCEHGCANCGSKDHMYYLPPIARVPRKKASKSVWNTFWKKLMAREFNHPKGGCI